MYSKHLLRSHGVESCHLPCRVLASLMFPALLVLPAYAQADDITYAGNSADLQTAPTWAGSGANNLFPGTTIAPVANGNTVTINYVAGAPEMTNPTTVYGGMSQTDEVANNVVIMNGGRVDGGIYGGCSRDGNVTHLAGGVGPGSSDLKTGNTLNLSSAGITVSGIRNFENYNFYLPVTLPSGSTILTVTNGDGLGNPVDISGTTVKLAVTGGTASLQTGDHVILIDSAVGLNGAPLNTITHGKQGVSLIDDLTLSTTPTQLLATITSVEVNPQAEALSEGRVAGIAFANQAVDLIIGDGMSSLIADRNKGGPGVFGVVKRGQSRYDTWPHVEVSGVSLLTGVSWSSQLNVGTFFAGGFFEAGWGNYDS